MGHYVQAFVGLRISLDKIQKEYAASKVVDLEQGFALLPLLDDLFDAIPNTANTEVLDKHFVFLTPKIVDLIVRHSVETKLAYVETDYFGGIGTQGAILAKDGRVVFRHLTGANSINAVLKLMGVAKGEAFDEFAAIGLCRFRHNEDWIENSP